ncbi:hypothetical protein ABZ832_22050 [Streptantibioticus parmotrematis]|uniref:hypothetical protein n=1 Tax=Streptantibioticus parmotrematis TaxID=2873249 RepID=UPI0033C51AAA
MANRDRRSTSDAATDRRLTGKLLSDAQAYCHRDDADAEFGTVIMTGCVTTRPSNYPPKGHGYPRKDR